MSTMARYASQEEKYDKTRLFRRFPERAIIGLIVLAALIGAVIPFMELRQSSLWMDELATVQIADPAISFFELFKSRIVHDVNPPAFYVLQHFWLQRFHDIVFGARLLSALSAVFTLLVLMIWGSRVFTWPTAAFLTASAATSFVFIYYATEARSYMLAVLLATLQTFVFQSALSRLSLRAGLQKPLLWLIVLTTVNGLTHYYGLIYGGALMGVLTLYALGRKDWRNLGLCVGAGLLTLAFVGGYAAWALSHAPYKVDASWIPNDRTYYFDTVKGFVWLALGGHHAFLIVIAGLAIAGLSTAPGEKRVAPAGFVDALPFGLAVALFVFMALAVSILWIPTVSSRYLLIGAPAFWIGTAWLVENGLQRALRPGRLVILVCCLLTVLYGMPFAFESGGPNREEWRNSAAYVSSFAACHNGPVPVYSGVKPELPPFFEFYLNPASKITPTPFGEGRTNPECPVKLWTAHALESDAVINGVLAANGGKARVVPFKHLRPWDCWPTSCHLGSRAEDVGATVIVVDP
jgi:hypothetical protein